MSENDARAELLPCPFCGSRDVILEQGIVTGAWAVTCLLCWSGGPCVKECLGSARRLGCEWTAPRSKAARGLAVELWNTRAA